jgi:eukaryotic-like serine/threonine-protein kinase
VHILSRDGRPIIPPGLTLTLGTRLGAYEIIAAIGAGGMGEVYRARDTKLNRDVALKILPQTFAADPDRLTRFTREAQTLASLNHPNIAQIHGLEDSSSVHALVMEFVDGADLSQRIASGPIPVDDTVAIARQVADAIEAAHEQGIVHRDLKPANIKVRADGTVKVLDFGLAKALEGSGATSHSGPLSMSPTFANPAMTDVGMIMGTAAYMSPEQAKGKPVDKRADIWSFGVVLYEMLTGRALFQGETVSEVLASVIMRDPDLNGLPAHVPTSLRHVIARCLVKDPKLRLRDIGEVRLVLSGAEAMQVTAAAPDASRGRGNRWFVALSAGLAVALAATGAALWRVGARAPAETVVRFEVQPRDQASLMLVARPSVALSADGSTLAFAAVSKGESRLYVRSFGEVTPRALAGTEGGSNPVFSPDGKQIAFYAAGRLKRTTLDGTVLTVTEAGADGDPRGIAWLADGTLVFASVAAGPLMQVPSGGGSPRAITTLDDKKGERTHRWPAALPNGKILFTIGTRSSPDNYDRSTIEAVDPATGTRQVVLEGASSARYAASGHLLFVRDSILYAIPFDLDSLTTRGTPVQVLRGVNGDTTTGASHLAIADNGTLTYAPGTAMSANRLVWVDRQGKTQPLDLPQGLFFDPRISPDGTRVAVVWQTLTAGTGDIWVSDLVRNTFTRLSFSGSTMSPAWSADGKSVYYSAIDPDGRKTTLMRKPADGSREAEAVAALDSRVYLREVTPDGKFALIDFMDRTGGMENGQVAKLALTANAKPELLVATPWDEYSGQWSPDKRWLAYQSEESGRSEIYVRDMSEGGGRWQVSTAGGEEPQWSADGQELYYRNESQLMAVAIDARTAFTPRIPTLLFEGVYNLRSDTGISYAVAAKGDRFLMVRLSEQNATSTVTVVTNWFAELRRLTSSAPR